MVSASDLTAASPKDEGARRAGRIGNVTGALLLGGRSTRMGRDKARLEWQGEAWSTRIARLLDDLFEQTLLVGGDPEPEAPGIRVADPSGPACALRGLVGALEAASAERVIVVATDLPLLTADLLLALTAWPESDAVVPRDDRGDHPLCAIYRREACLAAARANLAAERLALRDLLSVVDTQRVALEALGVGIADADVLTNINTPEELATVEGV
ncbi:MAG: molybdenum cofactor guanylyltransferase [Deltaproteobacteria bacterium]|jgi:molybdopterin-guanine dinucleotide biosynthesis protein A|nr:molybdenum cofactor guanylyltransferase [Deltaproteobacteria bacterium]MBW2498433.1 molybdenum cofactor guanylyltransferase [Deltaproteobacteria bacterium]